MLSSQPHWAKDIITDALFRTLSSGGHAWWQTWGVEEIITMNACAAATFINTMMIVLFCLFLIVLVMITGVVIIRVVVICILLISLFLINILMSLTDSYYLLVFILSPYVNIVRTSLILHSATACQPY